MRGRGVRLTAMAAGCLLVLSPAALPVDKRLVFNATASVPAGFYWLGGRRPQVGDLALVWPPGDLERWMAARRYLALKTPLIKRIGAAEGQHVCIRSGAVLIDGSQVAVVLGRDRLGRPLAASSLCRRLGASEVFLLNDAPRSLDGRYFGPIDQRHIAGRLTPLWTWER